MKRVVGDRVLLPKVTAGESQHGTIAGTFGYQVSIIAAIEFCLITVTNSASNKFASVK
ncbi:hypothetical protein [Pantanalinema sp. GBBB05]|uniref:hypothetical protein n=1 Tax=Pantanalinema sp. GBBB05 TaxID=2604139 RepID=UPI003D8157EA